MHILVFEQDDRPVPHGSAGMTDGAVSSSNAGDIAAIGVLNHLAQRARVPLSFNKSALPAGNPHLGSAGWTVEVRWNGEVCQL